MLKIAIKTSHISFSNLVVKYMMGCFTEARHDTV